MSGIKIGKAELEKQRKEVLRLQREREELIRRMRELQRRDHNRREVVQQEIAGLQVLIRSANEGFARLRAAGIDSDAQALVSTLLDIQRTVDRTSDELVFAGKRYSTDLASWRHAHERSQAEFESVVRRQLQLTEHSEQSFYDRIQADLQQAARQISAEMQDSPDNPEMYRGGHFDAFDLTATRRQAEEVLEVIARLERRAEAVRAVPTEAAARAALDVAREELARFAPALRGETALEALDRELARLDALIHSGDATSAAELTAALTAQVAEQLAAATSAADAWRARLDATRAELDDATQDLASLDEEHMRDYAPGALEALEGEVRAIVRALETAEPADATALDQAREQIAVLRGRIAQARQDADTASAEDLERDSIWLSVKDALAALGYNVRESSESDAGLIGPRQLTATRGSQRIALAIALDNSLKFSLNDQIGDADCVDDLQELIDQLAGDQVEVAISDWGAARGRATSARAGTRTKHTGIETENDE